MSIPSPQELEGRLNAHREVLAMILASVMRQPGNDIARRIDEGATVQDHQEDPGALPDQAFAIEAATAREWQLLVARARAIRDAP